MTITRLPLHALQPESSDFAHVFSALKNSSAKVDFSTLQPRLYYALTQLTHRHTSSPFLLVRTEETQAYLSLLRDAIHQIAPSQPKPEAFTYHIEEHNVSLAKASETDSEFAPAADIAFANWIEHDQLFGCVRQLADTVTLQPGLIHRVNGGILVLSLRAVLAQPLLWLRLKQMIVQERFDWLPADESRPLPISIPSLPLNLKLVLSGDRESLADFQEMEPAIAENAIYSEYEENIQIADDQDMQLWANWVVGVAANHSLPSPAEDSWPVLINEATRYTGDQQTLPLCPEWLKRQLQDVALECDASTFTATQLAQTLATRIWREGFLPERVQDEILLDQILIETEGERVGQINALSVVEFPGHPRAFGEPSRISCVVHIGDGEFTDIERKAELGGNIHAKGMMIMQSFLMAELQLEQQLPFSASLTFEQSYSEVDGDSASMAELCALISALAGVPINQQIAITGSVDQFGRAQPVGGLNEKIEGFFAICNTRGLTGQQGVIIPTANVRHLSLHQDVVDAVEAQNFFIWSVENVQDALPLLTGLPWSGEAQSALLQVIQDRIAQAMQQEARHYPWPLRWLNWFNHN